MDSRRKNDIFGIGLGILILMMALIADVILLNNSIEPEKRLQARYNLEQISHCYNRIKNDYSPQYIFNTCTGNSKTSQTGDVYILDAKSLEFIYENSNDVPKKMFFTKDSVGKYFNKWESAEKALEIMLNGKDSEKGTNTSYNFDGEREWLEWKYVSSSENENSKLIIVQGIQRDEILGEYSLFRRYSASCIFFVVFMLMVSHNVNKKTKESCDAVKRTK